MDVILSQQTYRPPASINKKNKDCSEEGDGDSTIVFLCIFFIMTCGTAKQASISKPPVSCMKTVQLVTIDQSESLHLVHIHV